MSHSTFPSRTAGVSCSPKWLLYRSRCSANASAITSSMSTQILFTSYLSPVQSSKRSYNRRRDTLHRHRLSLRSIPRRIVVQQSPAALARHHRLVVPAIPKIVPPLRPQHHLAYHALLIQRLGHRRSLGLPDPVIHPERGLPDL